MLLLHTLYNDGLRKLYTFLKDNNRQIHILLGYNTRFTNLTITYRVDLILKHFNIFCGLHTTDITV